MACTTEYRLAGPGADETRSCRRRDVVAVQLSGVLMFAIGIVGGILIGIYAYHGSAGNSSCSCCNIKGTSDTQRTFESDEDDVKNEPSQMVCARKNDLKKPDEISEKQLFAPLTADEMTAVREFCIKEGIITDKTEMDVSLNDNYIMYMHQFVPSKKDALEFLDKGGAFPGRYARLYVTRGVRDVPDLMEYVVGPIGSDVMKAESQYRDGELTYESRPVDAWEMMAFAKLLETPFTVMQQLTKESFDGSFYPNGGIEFFYVNGSPGDKKGMREMIIMPFFNPWEKYYDYHFFDFLPLSATIHCEGKDTSTWYVHSFYYLNQGPFRTADDLMRAYNGGSLRKFKHKAGYRETVTARAFPQRNHSLPPRTNAEVPPPRTYEPEGHRYSVKGHHVNWMDWSFDISTSMVRGPSLFNVKFKGQRIVYELSLNDIALIYGSDSSGRSNLMFTDATYAIGGYYKDLIQSVDCPDHATFLETGFYSYFSGTPVMSKSICLYEADGEEALWRHKPNSYSAGLRNNFLVVRVPATIANYDYIVEFHFLLDGKLYTKVKATGMIQGTFWDPENPNIGDDDSRDAFGFRVSDFTHGMMHDHMFGFKVDMDIIDSSNSFEVVHFKSGDVVDALNTQKSGHTMKPPYFKYDVTRFLEYETVQQESAFRINLDKPKLWTVVNEKHRNAWGAKKGYLISPLGTASQTMADSYPALQALSFTKNHCVVTKHSDREQYLTHITDGYRLDDPIGDMEKQLNNESVVNEDIVNWVTVGFLHVPTSEDVPMTVVVETGFLLKPFNFFDRTPVYDMPQFTEDAYDKELSERPPDFKPCLEDKP